MVAVDLARGSGLAASRSASNVLLLAAPLAVLLVVFFLPIGTMFWESVFVEGELTLKNYVKLFTAPQNTRSLYWTFELALGVSIGSVLVAYPVAYAMANGSPRLRWFLLACAMLPLWTSSLARTFAWVQILGAQGVINRTLIGLGIVETPLRLLFNQLAVYIGSIHDKAPYMVLCIYGGMLNIDKNLVRTAETLGASRTRAFFLTYVPQTMPGVAAGIVLVFISSLGLYTTPAVLGGSGTRPFTLLIQRNMNELLDWGFAAALGGLLVATTVVFYLVLGRRLGLAAGADEQRQSGAVGAYRLFSGVDRFFAWMRKVRGQRGIVQPLPLWDVVAIVIGLILALPILLIVLLAFSSSYVPVFPPPGFSLHLFELYFTRAEWVDATVMSFVIAFATAILTTVLAVPTALALRRMSRTPRAVVSSLLLMPMMVPTVVYGAAAFMQFINVPFMDRKLIFVLTHTTLALPPALLLIMAAAQGLDQRLEDAAASLGASPWRRFRSVTLPLILPAAAAGSLVAFLTSFDDLGIALFVTNSSTMTLPKRMLDAMVLEADPRTTAASALLIMLSLLVLLGVSLLQRRIALSKAHVHG